MRKETKNMSLNTKFLVLSALLFMLAGCAGPVVSGGSTSAINEREQKFASNVDSFGATDSKVQEVVQLMKQYAVARNMTALDTLENLIAADFELHYLSPARQTLEKVGDAWKLKKADERSDQSRTDYFSRISSRPHNMPFSEQLILNIRDVSFMNQSATEAVVRAGTTYKSKYFHPRYEEIYVWEKVSHAWKLQKVIVTPSPPKPNEIVVSLVSLAKIDATKFYNPETLRNFVEQNGPDAIFESIIVPASLASDRQPLVIVFSEPPTEGAEVFVNEIGMNSFPSTTFFHRSSPYTIFVGLGWFNPGNLAVRVEVFVDGVKVGSGWL